jgi:DNA replication protein DnaC
LEEYLTKWSFQKSHLLAELYERRSVMMTSNLVFSEWDQIFKDPLTTATAIDWVAHHNIIIEFGKEIPSLRAEEAARRNKISFSNSLEGNK